MATHEDTALVLILWDHGIKPPQISKAARTSCSSPPQVSSQIDLAALEEAQVAGPGTPEGVRGIEAGASAPFSDGPREAVIASPIVEGFSEPELTLQSEDKSQVLYGLGEIAHCCLMW